ncbi:unnamed protein product [Prunus armeniaca]|uniref:Uncharacterized protein n=1 Tax=Prunus armeniaca TaxID=36596 RepID=A0A6J5UJ56_PRUAR|nr:unnamed protein product [Prunus armeniaca]
MGSWAHRFSGVRSVERTRSLPCQPMTCRGCKSDGAQCFQDIAYGFELFPKWDRLTASDLSATPHDGSKFRISFKVHSLRKNAAIKAYRNCETAKLFHEMSLKMLFMELGCNVDIQSDDSDNISSPGTCKRSNYSKNQ